MIMSTKEICKRGLSMTISLTLGNTAELPGHPCARAAGGADFGIFPHSAVYRTRHRVPPAHCHAMRAAVTAAAALAGHGPPKGKPPFRISHAQGRGPTGPCMRGAGTGKKTGVCPAYYGIMGCWNRTQRARRKFCRAAGLACTLGAAAKNERCGPQHAGPHRTEVLP